MDVYMTCPSIYLSVLMTRALAEYITATDKQIQTSMNHNDRWVDGWMGSSVIVLVIVDGWKGGQMDACVYLEQWGGLSFHFSL